MPALDPFSSRFLTGKMSHQCRLIGATKFDDDEVKIKAFLIMALRIVIVASYYELCVCCLRQRAST